MIKLNWSSSYRKAFNKTIRNNPAVKIKILEAMELLHQDPFIPKLNWACSVDYDMRIVFDFVKNQTSDETEILLMNIGTHDEVY